MKQVRIKSLSKVELPFSDYKVGDKVFITEKGMLNSGSYYLDTHLMRIKPTSVTGPCEVIAIVGGGRNIEVTEIPIEAEAEKAREEDSPIVEDPSED